MNFNKKLRILITGFAKNDSAKFASELTRVSWPQNIELITKDLLFSYKEVENEISNIWESIKPDLLIHLNAELGPPVVSVEKCAFNRSYRTKDITGFSPPEKYAIENGHGRLETSLDVEKLCKNGEKVCLSKVNNSILKCSLSKYPGDHVPGFLYYHSLNKNRAKCLLINIPSKLNFSPKEIVFTLVGIILEALNQLFKLELKI